MNPLLPNVKKAGAVAMAMITGSGLDLTDALGLVGFALLISGVADFSQAAAKIVAGACTLTFVILRVRRK